MARTRKFLVGIVTVLSLAGIGAASGAVEASATGPAQAVHWCC